MFHGRNYKNLLEYLEDPNDIISESLVGVWIEQLLENERSEEGIPMPPALIVTLHVVQRADRRAGRCVDGWPV